MIDQDKDGSPETGLSGPVGLIPGYAPEDPEVLALCLKWGFGAVMGSASRLWQAKDPVGALTVGPTAFEARNFALQGRKPMTAKQERLFGFIVGQIERTHRSPNQIEMAAFMGGVARNAIHYMLKNMARDGWVTLTHQGHRTVMPILERVPALGVGASPKPSTPSPVSQAPAPPCPYAGRRYLAIGEVLQEGDMFPSAASFTGLDQTLRFGDVVDKAEWYVRPLTPGTDLDPAPPEDTDIQFRLVRANLIDAWSRAWSKHPGTPHIRAALKTMIPKGISLADVHALDAIRDSDIAVQVPFGDLPVPACGLWTRSREDIQSYDGNGEPVVFLYPPDESQERIAIRGLDCHTTAARLLAVLNGSPAPVEGKGPGGVARPLLVADVDVDGEPMPWPDGLVSGSGKPVADASRQEEGEGK